MGRAIRRMIRKASAAMLDDLEAAAARRRQSCRCQTLNIFSFSSRPSEGQLSGRCFGDEARRARPKKYLDTRRDLWM